MPSPYARSDHIDLNAAYYSIITFRRATVKTDQEAARSQTGKLEIPITRNERDALARLNRA